MLLGRGHQPGKLEENVNKWGFTSQELATPISEKPKMVQNRKKEELL